MISTVFSICRLSVLAIFLVGATAASAHTGHGTAGLLEGLEHPFGNDHLLAMVAVGVWSVAALPKKKTWWGPLTFMAALVVSAVVGAAGFTLPHLEIMVALSVVLFGVMLVLCRSQMPVPVGLLLIAVAASLHGLAHGSETPESGFATYAAGFLVTTAALHFGGVLAGLSLRRHFHDKAIMVTRVFGAVCGGAGLYLVSQL